MAWIMESSGPVNTNFITPEGKPFVGDAPLYFFRIDPAIDNGFPYVPLMLNMPSLEPPVTVYNVFFSTDRVSDMFVKDTEAYLAYWRDTRVF
jgi:hypothetical protein